MKLTKQLKPVFLTLLFLPRIFGHLVFVKHRHPRKQCRSCQRQDLGVAREMWAKVPLSRMELGLGTL